jgi:hypothetical protein
VDVTDGRGVRPGAGGDAAGSRSGGASAQGRVLAGAVSPVALSGPPAPLPPPRTATVRPAHGAVAAPAGLHVILGEPGRSQDSCDLRARLKITSPGHPDRGAAALAGET